MIHALPTTPDGDLFPIANVAAVLADWDDIDGTAIGWRPIRTPDRTAFQGFQIITSDGLYEFAVDGLALRATAVYALPKIEYQKGEK